MSKPASSMTSDKYHSRCQCSECDNEVIIIGELFDGPFKYSCCFDCNMSREDKKCTIHADAPKLPYMDEEKRVFFCDEGAHE
jgi:hypothetical protein